MAGEQDKNNAAFILLNKYAQAIKISDFALRTENSKLKF